VYAVAPIMRRSSSSTAPELLSRTPLPQQTFTERRNEVEWGSASKTADSHLQLNSAPYPVVDLDLEDVGRTIAENRATLSAKIEIAGRVAAGATLRPHEEDRRPRTILPPQHRVSNQRTECEIGIAKREGCGRTRAIRIYSVLSAIGSSRRCPRDRAYVLTVYQLVVRPCRRELTERRVRAAGYEWLREQ